MSAFSQQMQNIPGGATTQIAQNTGAVGPERAVGLTPEQIQTGRDRITPKSEMEPIPIGLPGYDEPQEEEQEPQMQQPDEGREFHVLRGPDKKLYGMYGPTGSTLAQAGQILSQLDPDSLKDFSITEGDVVDRFIYGFHEGENITTNIGLYAKSHYPWLAGEFRWTPEEGFEWVSATEIYGEDLYDLSEQERRERIKEVDIKNLQAEYADKLDPRYLGTAGTVGKVVKGIADPVALTPAGKAYQGIRGAAQVAKQSAKVGAAWGAAYGGSEVLAQRGAPTSLDELGQAIPQVAIPTAIGAVAGPVLGVAGHTVGKVFSRQGAANALADPVKTGNFARKKYWPMIWEEQLKGKTAAEATSAVRKHYKLSLNDEWRLRHALMREGEEFIDVPATPAKELTYKQEQKQLAKEWEAGMANVGSQLPKLRKGTALYSTATSKRDAAKRLGEAAASRYGDPIILGKRQQQVDNLLRPIAGIVKDISPRIYKRLVDMEGAILRNMHYYHEALHPFKMGTKALSKRATPEDYNKFTKALMNGHSDDAKKIWSSYGMDDQTFDTMRTTLNALADQMEDAGIKFQRLGDYFPRIVHDYDGFRALAGKNPKLMGLEKHLRAQARKKGHDLSDYEQAQLINRWMGKTNKKTKDVKGLKNRRIREVTDEMLPYYHDPVTALEFHMRETISKIERNRFYGKNNVKMHDSIKGLEDIQKSIGAMMAEEGINGKAASRLQDVLLSRFTTGERTGGNIRNSLRQLTGGATLGNPMSALRQLGDIPAIMRTQGIANTLSSMIRRADPDVNPDIMGYMLEMAQELDAKGLVPWVRTATDKMYKVGGFRAVDRYTKGTLLRASLKNMQSITKSGKKTIKFIKKYADIYEPDELQQLIKDIKLSKLPKDPNNPAAGAISDLMKSHLNAEFMRIQPISRSQMPKLYLDMPNGRMFWQFRTWSLNQIELIRTDIWRQLKSGSASERIEGSAKALLFVGGIGVTNAGITEAQKLLSFRDRQSLDQLGDDVIWQMMGNFGLDRYGIEKWAESQDPTDYLKSFAPPALTIPAKLMSELLDSVMNDEPAYPEDVRDVLKASGGIGRILDFWLLGGAEEYNEKQKEEERKALKAAYGG